ncbi:hypothetical protein DL764_002163 [Monosporascus ibericus]|uniref:NACHT domain-containing protein n=1 Tax=Monosporascus ibericus TaxID=155417 RepID=A0A4Q4TQ09_9PEZI|nr:hypothetical protein DL764_002163 [Monosporascus ibericus]
MAGRANQSVLHGQGVQNSGSGNVTVGRDLNIGVPNNNCLSDLRSTDPRYDKKRIEQTKGGLLRDSYRWILDHDDFLRWRNNPDSRLFWIKGDPGKGKTMLLCGIIDELKRQTANTTHLLSFFFCQATDGRLNNATAVLRGLIYLLVDQQRSLISHIQEKYNHAGKALFEDVNAWVALSDILTGILQDPSLPDTTLIIDALDECRTDLAQLLDLIIQLPVLSRVKWIVSSRNWPHIEEHLNIATQKVRLCLELNESSISYAVRIYIRYKVDQLARLKRYNDCLRSTVQDYMVSNASDTFLWVALVYQALADPKVRAWNTLAKLRVFPPGLDSLYGRMMDQIIESEDVQICTQILAVTSVVYRPLTLRELTSLIEPLDNFPDNFESLEGIIKLCGSFLTLRKETVFFIHQSAKDYLLQNATNRIFPSYIEDEHYAIGVRSLQIMSRTLQRDIYRLNDWGLPTDQVTPPSPDPLAAARYSCIHWVDHLAESKLGVRGQAQYEDLRDGGMIDRFLRRHYLHWLEALSILGEPRWLILKPAVEHNWSACLSTLEGHRDSVSSVTFSPDGSRLVSGSWDDTVKVWDAAAGACLSTLKGHRDNISSVAFSSDGSRLVSGSWDKTVRVWDAATGACLSTLEGHRDSVSSVWDAATGACLSTLKGHRDSVSSVAFSSDGSRLVSGSYDGTVKVWDAATGACLSTLKGHHGNIISVAFSPDGSRLVSGSWDGTVKVWDAATGACLSTLKGHRDIVSSVAFSPDGSRLASGSYDDTVKVWDAATGACLSTLKGHRLGISSVAFSPDGSRLVSGSWDDTVKVWDAAAGAYLSTLEGHRDSVSSVAFSPDGSRLVSGSRDDTVKVWDAATGACLSTLEGYRDSVSSVAFSSDGSRLASGSRDDTVKVWDAATGACLSTLKGHRGKVSSVTFSPDGSRLVSGSWDKTVKVWDAATGACLSTLEGHHGQVSSVAFSSDGSRLASGSYDDTVKHRRSSITQTVNSSSRKAPESLSSESYLLAKSLNIPDLEHIRDVIVNLHTGTKTANENAARATNNIREELNATDKTDQENTIEIKNNTDAVQAANTAAGGALEASKVILKVVRDMKRTSPVQTLREIIVNIRDSVTIANIRAMSPRSLKAHVDRAIEQSSNEHIDDLKAVSANQMKGDDLSIKTARTTDMEALRQFAEIWEHRIGHGATVRISTYGVLAHEDGRNLPHDWPELRDDIFLKYAIWERWEGRHVDESKVAAAKEGLTKVTPSSPL